MSRLHAVSNSQNVDRKVDVIFVHGLGGDAFSTWKSGEGASWPHWLGEDLPEVGVWSLDYAASPSKWGSLGRLMGDRDAGHAMALPDRAAQVLDSLVLDGFGERPLFFICHSLGGLLVKQILRTSGDSVDPRRRRVAEQTRAVLFLATPHAGATLASIADRFRAVFGATVSIEDLKAHDAHLRDLYNWYRNHSVALGITTRTYFELRGVGGVLPIVDATSAQPGVGDDAIGLDEDHFSIVKPRSRDAQVCRAALDLLRRHVLTAGPQNEKPPPTAEPTGRLTTLPPPAPVPIPRQLPPAAENFFGREAELEKLEKRLRKGKNTAVVGPGGLGKTALAAEALRRVVGDGGDLLAASSFPDGIVFLDLYAWHGQPEPAWNNLASSLGSGEFLADSPARVRAIEACRGRSVLVIVEGGEVADGKEGRASIEHLFAVLDPKNCRLLLTREPRQTIPAESVTLREALDPADAGKLLDSLSDKPLAGPLREKVLVLLQGHPLALTWAGNLLARGDEPARRLIDDWEQDPMLQLSDPKNAEHTLQWLFDRSVRGLDDGPKKVLAAAGLVAHAPFPGQWMTVVSPNGGVPDCLRILVQRGFLRLIENEELWQFGHVLAYRFARVESGSDPLLRERLAASLQGSLRSALQPGGDLTPVGTLLDHAAALLRTDEDQRLWISLANPLLYVFFDRLREIGRLPLAQRALAALHGWIHRMPATTAGAGQWKSERAWLLDREGDLRLEQGDLTAALDSYRESLEIRRRLADSDPSNATEPRDLGVILDHVGNVLKGQVDLDIALDAFREFLGITRRLVEADPSYANAQRSLSVSLDKVGNVRKERGDRAGALEVYRESLRIRRRLVEADPSNATRQRDLGVSHNKIGNVLKEQGNLDLALYAYREDLEIARRLAEDDPSNAILQRDLSICHNKIGDVLKEQGDLTAALGAYRNSLEVRRRLAEADSSSATGQRDLGVSYEKVGDVLKEHGDLAGALDVYRKSLVIRRRLVEADPSNATWQRDMSVTLNRLAILHEALGEPPEALRFAEECLAIFEKLAALDPTNATWQKDVKASRALIERLRRG